MDLFSNLVIKYHGEMNKTVSEEPEQGEHIQGKGEAVVEKTALLDQQEMANLVLELISITVAGMADPDSILLTAIRKMRSLMPVDEAHILLAERDKLVLRGANGAPPSFHDSLQVISWGECLCGLSAREDEVMTSDNLIQDPRVSFQDCLREGFSSRLCLPLRWQGKVSGVLSVARRDPCPFSPQEQEWFTSLSNKLSMVIENIRLHTLAEERTAQLSKIAELSQATTSSLDIQKVYDAFVRVIRNEVEVDWGTISFTEGDKLQVVALGGKAAPPWKLGVDTPLSGTASEWLREHLQPLISPDLAKECRFWTEKVAFKHGTRSILRYPMVFQGKLFAALSLGSSRPHAYGSREVEIVGRYIDQLSIAAHNARLFAQAQERGDRLAVLHQIGRTFASSLRLEEVYDTFASQVKKLVDFDNIRINLIRGDKIETVAIYPREKTALGKGQLFPLEETGTAWIARQRQTHISADLDQERKFPSDTVYFRAGMRSVIRLPLFHRHEVFGTIVLSSSRPEAYGEREKELLQDIAGEVSPAVQNFLLYEASLEASSKDSLTGLFHHREFYQLLKEEVERARRYSRPLSLLLIDLDQFKGINEGYGHQVGDEVLRELSSRVVLGQKRATDIAARYGGDEFALILPETDREGGLELAQRLVKAARGEAFYGDKVRLTLSVGVAAFPRDGVSAETLVSAADRAMFQAKEQGGDQAQPA